VGDSIAPKSLNKSDEEIAVSQNAKVIIIGNKTPVIINDKSEEINYSCFSLLLKKL
jgi:hypothetical protein